MTHANHTLQDQIKDKTCDRINQGQTANYIRGIDNYFRDDRKNMKR